MTSFERLDWEELKEANTKFTKNNRSCYTVNVLKS